MVVWEVEFIITIYSQWNWFLFCNSCLRLFIFRLHTHSLYNACTRDLSSLKLMFAYIISYNSQKRLCENNENVLAYCNIKSSSYRTAGMHTVKLHARDSIRYRVISQCHNNNNNICWPSPSNQSFIGKLPATRGMWVIIG